MTDRYAAWAQRRVAQKKRVDLVGPRPAPPANAPQLVQASGIPYPQAQVVPAPVYFAVQTPRIQPRPAPRLETCVIVKVDGASDKYSELIAATPDLPVPNYNPDGYDAMRAPSYGRFEKWTPYARRTYGGRDVDGQVPLEQHLSAKHAEVVPAIVQQQT